MEFLIPILTALGGASVAAGVGWWQYRKVRRSPPLSTSELSDGKYYEVYRPEEVGKGKRVIQAYSGWDARKAKRIRRELRMKGYDAVVFSDGEYRG